MSKIVRLIIILCTFLVIMLLDDARTIGSIEMCLYFIYILYDVYKARIIRLCQVWVAAFIFIILSDIIITNPIDLWSTRYLIVANNMVLLAYLFTKKTIKIDEQKLRLKLRIDNPKAVRYFILFCYLLYIAVFTGRAMTAFHGGRIDESEIRQVNDMTGILTSIISSLGLLLPSIIVFFYKNIGDEKADLKALALSSPVFILLFMMGSRFPLLFSVLGFLISGGYINVFSISKRQVMTIIVCGFLFISVSSMMKDIRIFGVDRLEKAESFNNRTALVMKDEKTIFVDIAEKMSPEGIIRMMNLSHEYFKKNEFTKGKTSTFLLYFWVPRFLWHDKPTMLGFWLPRKLERNLGQYHSASFGFPGELYADFGIYSLLAALLFGIFLKRLDCFVLSNLLYNHPKRILASMMFPYVFFFVRSPITATMTLLGILLYIYLYIKVLRPSYINEEGENVAFN